MRTTLTTATMARLASTLLLLLALPATARGQEVLEYYGTDALGTVRVVYTPAGTLVARTDLLPFGEPLEATPGGPPEQFTGQERDPEAGQDYFHARMYQPRAGRFTGVDPVYAGLFDPQQWNRYAYVGNNPLRYLDPDGRCTVEKVGNKEVLKDCDGAMHVEVVAVGGQVAGGIAPMDVARALASNDAFFLEMALGLGLGVIPLAGELLDLEVVLDSEADALVRLIAAASLLGNAATGSVGPNVGRVARAGRKAVRDYATRNTKNWSAMFRSEGEARALANQKLGANPVEVSPGKWRSADGKWQYRAKPGDVSSNHIHLEELDPATGEVLQNLQLRWPQGGAR